MKKKYSIAAATLFAGGLVLTGCSGSSGPGEAIADDCTPIVDGVETMNEGKLTAVVMEYPPYVTQAGNELAGVDGELLKRVAAELCLELETQTQGAAAIYENVRSGSADLTSGNHYLNKERQEIYEVSTPVYRDQMVILSNDGISSIDEMEGKAVGTTQGYLWVGDFQNALGSSNVQLYASEDATYQDVANGRIEAGIVTDGGARQILEANNNDTLKAEPFEPTDQVEASVNPPQSVVLITKGNTTLLEAVNAVLDEMHEDGSLVEALEENGFDASAADVDPSVLDN